MNPEFTVSESFYDFFEDDSRFLISYGGAGSGKSYNTGIKILTRLMSEAGHRFLVTRKVASTLRPSVFQLFKDLIYSIGAHKYFDIRKSDMTITYTPNGSSILFFGLDNVERLKSVQGITGIWLEEASEMDENDLNELNRRLRGETMYYKQIIITFNPISHLHWLKARFFDHPNSKAKIFKSTYLDNPFLDEDYIIEIEEMRHYDEQQYRVYALGEWGIFSNNKVYHNYDFAAHVSPRRVSDFQTLHVGVDFNIGGCVAVICGIEKATQKVHVVDSWAVYDTNDMVNQLLPYTRNNTSIYIYPDSYGNRRTTNSSKSDVAILREGGFEVVTGKSNPAIRDRVNAVNRLFAQNKLLVSFEDGKNERFAYAMSNQVYSETGEPDKGKDHQDGALDDYADAIGYFIARKFPIMMNLVKRKKHKLY